MKRLKSLDCLKDRAILIVSAHQPGYIPYIGLFNKMMQSDLFVLLDNVQYVKREWHNRNKIREYTKGWMWLTVPVHRKMGFQQIKEITIDNSKNWRAVHRKSIQAAYGRTPYFHQYAGFFEDVYSMNWEKLIDLNETIITYIVNALDIQTKIVKGSTLKLVGKKTDLLIDMCKKTQSDTYLSGIGGRQYLDEEKFEEHGITLAYQDFHHPTYRQQNEPFIPYLSVIDVLFNLGNENSRKLILSSGRMIPAGASQT